MFGYERIELKNQKGRFFYCNVRKVLKEILEIERLIHRHPCLRHYSEPKRQIKEGIIGEDDSKKRENLSNGYRFILEHPVIDDHNLHILYGILSEDQLDEYSRLEDASSYRKKDVFILDTNINKMGGLSLAGGFDKGVSPKQVKECMESLFEYLDKKELDPFLKSQIAHFYFVYIHPFYDVNGRSARTLSSWYLINEGKNPYTILNRGISFNRYDYLLSIKKSRRGDMTPFIETTLGIIKKELQLQVSINEIRKAHGLTREECETLEMLLRTPNMSVRELENTYLYHKGIYDRSIISNKVLQLLEKGVISLDKTSKLISLVPDGINEQYRRNYGSRQNR